jgi:type IV secretory pathway VirJ component
VRYLAADKYFSIINFKDDCLFKYQVHLFKLNSMKKTSLISILFALVLIIESGAATPSDSVSIAPFGKVFIYKHTNTPENVVIMISGDGGWNLGVTGFSQTFSEMNCLVIGVDVQRYFKELRQRTEDCYRVVSDFVQLATEIEKKYNYSNYTPPLIMGYSSGATLVYGILAQSRPGTFIGGISVGFCPDIDLPKMLCQMNGLTERVDVPGKSYFLQPDAKLGNQWIVLQGKLDKVCNYSEVEDFVNKTTDAELITLPTVGHGFSKWSDFMPQWKDAFNRLIRHYKESQISSDNIDQVKGLPLVLTNAKIKNIEAPIALLISGDGGWYGFEQSIADNLAGIGIPTIGLDSKKYFWNRRTPEETSADVAGALSFYSKKWGKEKFLLVGYSLGAEIVPFIVNRLPEDMKSKIVSSVLLSPEPNTDFEVHFSNMLGMGSRQNTYKVIDEITKLFPVPTLIIIGEGEKSEVPALLKGTSVKIRTIPGDHHYKFNSPLIIQTMKENNAI